MTVSVIVPVHDKPEETVAAVLCALIGQEHEETQLVLDRPSACVLFAVEHMRPLHQKPPGLNLIRLEGPPGWRSPCIAANAGLREVTGDVTIYNPSDIVQAPGNIERLKAMYAAHPGVYFSKVLESKPEECVGRGHVGPVLCASYHPRPLTFLFAAPTEALRAIGGWDEAFQDGVCYEDDDLVARLWSHGLDFIFDDRFNGIHQSHKRSYFTDIRIAPNMAHMLRKHGTTRVFDREHARGRLKAEMVPGRTVWRHA